MERHYSLSEAARIIGVGRGTLKRWLAEELAIVLPRVERGSKLMLRESQLEIVLRRRQAKSNFALLRKGAA